MRYETLGRLRVTDADQAHSLSARKTAVALAVLLIRAGQVVPMERLITEIWDDDPPTRATAAVHVYVSHLRRFLAGANAASQIVTRAPGYRLTLGTDEVDADRFHELLWDGREHAARGSHERAAELLESALGLWRGPALDGLHGSAVVDGYVGRLAESRLAGIETLMEAKLALGRHREVVGSLYSLAAEHPTREKLHRQLMLALYRSERQADALRAYHSLRRCLQDSVGLEPGRGLQELYHSILVEDARLETPTGPI
ncbi:SARP family transcriptional regulator, regulator of embCAB operon [Frankia sp. AiPs1]|uniref:AfsR/SARP family transcriptional regulator n=1 Tax=Frankia sp. AiPa1 TaxID=573492 RepID=UPI00202B0097|nr:AfsR/SARP family transcriptional regulator [Frankia sp. AiPa1]MCL9762951.1 AfsR/SARP family transcriptional regulator [Frankia sp. AiPa1]